MPNDKKQSSIQEVQEEITDLINGIMQKSVPYDYLQEENENIKRDT